MNQHTIINEILGAYLKLRSKANVFTFEKFNVVLLINPKFFNELVSALNGDVFWERDIDVQFIYLAGMKTPVIIEYSLPESVKFQIMSQKEYERLEQEKMISKFTRMFDF